MGPNEPLSKKDRPRIVLQAQGLDRTLLLLSTAAAVAVTLRVALAWQDLPETIALHFDLQGRPDGFGSRGIILLMPAMAWLMNIMLTVVQRFPHIFNYAWPITRANARAQYELAFRLMSWVRLVATLVMAYLGWVMAESAEGAQPALGAWFLPASGIAVILALAAYLVRAYRNRRPEDWAQYAADDEWEPPPDQLPRP
ncbi:DUF1648 domain-containing protein [Candidatus Fermentibacterales bacterium]|nr:DUF1648 domain-containing protein [Candidatus Fermentibacterales bacterium]